MGGRAGGGIARHLLLRNRRVVGVDFDPQALARWREAGLPVVFGDAEDPELFAHLPLADAGWVVSTAPGAETSRVLLRHLQQAGYTGRVAVACRTPEEEDTLRIEGASAILRPFAAAAEQAADLLTSAMDRVEALATRAPGLREVRLSPGSMWAGHTIGQARLREQLGVTVLAVSRSGRSFLNPGPDFQLFPGDRLILSGEPHALERAVGDLSRFDPAAGEEMHDFEVVELSLERAAAWHDRTLAELELRTRFGVTVVSIHRPDGTVVSPGPHYVLHAGDRLVVAGASQDLARIREASQSLTPIPNP